MTDQPTPPITVDNMRDPSAWAIAVGNLLPPDLMPGGPGIDVEVVSSATTQFIGAPTTVIIKVSL